MKEFLTASEAEARRVSNLGFLTQVLLSLTLGGYAYGLNNEFKKIQEKDARLVEIASDLQVDLPTDLRVVEQTPESITIATANGTQTVSRLELEEAQAQLIKEYPQYADFLNTGKIKIFNGTNSMDSVN